MTLKHLVIAQARGLGTPVFREKSLLIENMASKLLLFTILLSFGGIHANLLIILFQRS